MSLLSRCVALSTALRSFSKCRRTALTLASASSGQAFRTSFEMCVWHSLISTCFVATARSEPTGMQVDTNAHAVGPHAHVDLVLHPHALWELAQALREPLCRVCDREDAGTVEDSGLHPRVRVCAVGEGGEQPRVEEQIHDIRPAVGIEPVP